jgi:hypothetical protein
MSCIFQRGVVHTERDYFWIQKNSNTIHIIYFHGIWKSIKWDTCHMNERVDQMWVKFLVSLVINIFLENSRWSRMLWIWSNCKITKPVYFLICSYSLNRLSPRTPLQASTACSLWPSKIYRWKDSMVIHWPDYDF